MDTDRIKGAAQEFGGKVQETVSRVAGDGSERAEGLARQVVGQGQNLYGQAKDGLRDVAGNVSDYAGQAYEDGSRYASRGSRELTQRVEANPLTALVVAGAVGYLLAVLLHGRS